MELVLYKFNQKFDPISFICEIWCSTYSFNLEIEISNFSFSSMGDLPILRFNNFLFRKDEILPFLKTILSIDWDLSEANLDLFKILENYCIKKLHPSNMYAILCSSAVNKHYFLCQTTIFSRIFSLLEHWVKRSEKINEIKTNSHIFNEDQAFESVEACHKLLSQTLKDNLFFSSEFSSIQRPHSIDFIIYSYLFEEICNLAGHPHVEDSLNKYENLLRFFQTMKNFINEKEKNNEKFLKFNYNENWIRTRCFKLKNKINCEEEIDKNDTNRSTFVTLCGGIFFLFLFLNRHKN